MAKYEYEDIVILCGATAKFTDMAVGFKELANFMVYKKNQESKDRFNLLLFQCDGIKYLEDVTNDYDYLIGLFHSLSQTKADLKVLNPKRVKTNVLYAIGLALSSFIKEFIQISDKGFHLIIIVDSNSLSLPDEHMAHLEHLIDHAKYLPLTIDVISVNTDDAKENSKFERIAKRTGGKIYEVEEAGDLEWSLELVGEKKEIEVSIPEEVHPFYENLTEKYIDFEQSETCFICFQKDEQKLVQCVSCGIVAHQTCLLKWADQTYIAVGLRHVFRCPACFALVMLDKNFVYKELYNIDWELPETQGPEMEIDDYLKIFKTKDNY